MPVRGETTGSGWGMLGLAAGAGIVAVPGVALSLMSLVGFQLREAFPARRLLELAWSHAVIAASALLPATVLGVLLGILITRRAGRLLKPFADALVAGSQAIPPVVVVALAFPALGFGAAPTVLALVIYCIMPILRGTAGALQTTAGDAVEAARAMGLTPVQIFLQVELPLALPTIAESLRIAFVLAVATAAVGALAGASTLGTPIVIGLQNQNEVYILQGAAATGALAFLADGLLLLALSALGQGRRSRPLAQEPIVPE
jgi:osmoprotectant transport system permease protein